MVVRITSLIGKYMDVRLTVSQKDITASLVYIDSCNNLQKESCSYSSISMRANNIQSSIEPHELKQELYEANDILDIVLEVIDNNLPGMREYIAKEYPFFNKVEKHLDSTKTNNQYIKTKEAECVSA
jgi:hypothetical protein